MLWNARYECGIPTVDEQHKELFRQVDILMDHGQKDRIPQTLDFLGQYVVKHFATEEAMHRRSNYPKAEKHHQIHRDFVNAYKELKKEYDAAGHKLAVVMKINRVAVGWLKEHIMGHDQEFARFYRQASGGTAVIGSQTRTIGGTRAQSRPTSTGTRPLGTRPQPEAPGTRRFGAPANSPTRVLGAQNKQADSPTRILGTPTNRGAESPTRMFGAQTPATGSPTRTFGAPPRQPGGGTTRLIGGQGGAAGSVPSLWNNSLLCGIPSVDEQHMELFRQVEILLDRNNRDPNRIAATLDYLGQYVVKHFATEEAMHRRSNYPKAESHRQIHRDFVNAYKDLKREFDSSGRNLQIVMKINKVAVAWLREHIMGQDKDFARFYKGAAS